MKFRLPDFRTHSGLNDVRAKMRADLIEWQVDSPMRVRRISLDDLRALETASLEIKINEINEEGSWLTYNGEQIVLYIMQPKIYNNKVKDPKFHVVNCPTWDSMKQKGKKDRYVVSRRIDGKFELHVPYLDGSIVKEERSLQICKNCLIKLREMGYGVEGVFSLSEFFKIQKKSFIKERPKFTSATMPSANYTDDFDEVSSAARAAAKWTCTNCRRRFTRAFERRFLHTHHLSGNRGDNSVENLRVLCLECHANQPDHLHMKKSANYKLFLELFGSYNKQ